MINDTENFVDVLELVCPTALDVPGQSLAIKISKCMSKAQDPNQYQSLFVLLNVDQGKRLDIYDCESHKLVGSATTDQALRSAKNLKDHSILFLQKKCYVY
jgi:hypothetical protein